MYSSGSSGLSGTPRKGRIKVGIILVFRTVDFTRSAWVGGKWTDNEPFTESVVMRGNYSSFGKFVIERECRPFGTDRSPRSGEKLNTL